MARVGGLITFVKSFCLFLSGILITFQTYLYLTSKTINDEDYRKWGKSLSYLPHPQIFSYKGESTYSNQEEAFEDKNISAIYRKEKSIGGPGKVHNVVLFNVLPKSGSRTLLSLVARLPNRYKPIDTMGMDDDHKRQMIRHYLQLTNMSSFMYSHLRFENITVNNTKPIYISIVRDPIDRLTSLYYYMRYGDNLALSKKGQRYREKMNSLNLSNVTFNECFTKDMKGCLQGITFRSPLVHFFCGTSGPECSLEQAKMVVKESYLVVGVMEDYLDLLKVLEKLLPRTFTGATNVYLNDMSTFVKNMKTKNKEPVSLETREKMKKLLEEDYLLYDVIKEDFDVLKKNVLIN